MANEIKFYLSGGSSNTNPFLSIGGPISLTEIVSGFLNNLWPDVSEAQASDGLIDHKIIYAKNVSGSPLTGIRTYFGEIDKFMGMQVTAATVKNVPITALTAATDAITQYFLVWQNIAETGATTTTVNLDATNKRVTMYVGDSHHPIYNQYPDQIELMLKKTGSPTGTAAVKVWAGTNTATDNTVIRTIGTIDVSTLTGTLAKYTFNTVADLVTNPLPSIGWRIGIEYTTGTATTHVDVGVTTQTTANNQTSWVEKWDGTKWTDVLTNWPAMNFWTNHGPCFQTGTPPPPGSGNPPPPTGGGGGGGGGGSQLHGYTIAAITDNGNDGNVAANAIDKNLATRWSQDSTNALLTLDLGGTNPIDSVKIAWYKGDERQAKFNIAYSNDNTTYTNVVAGGGSSFRSSGTSLALQTFSFAQQAGMTTSTAGDVTAVSITLEVPWLAMTTGDNPGGTSAAFIVRDLADELLECITNPITNGSGADKGWMNSSGYEICDLCENHSNATTATFPDGLQVPYYWDTQTAKCVAPGAASGGVSISESPTYTNHGGPVIGNATVYLIFWGPTWSSQTTYKNTVIDLVQNKLLGTDAASFFAAAKADYNINAPVWGGSATNTASAANTSNYKSADVMLAITQAINAGSVPNPANSSFTTSGGQRCSNFVYCVIPDLSWHAYDAADDTSIVEAIHLSMTFSTATGDPNPPPAPPPPSTGLPPPGTPLPPPGSGGPNPFDARYIRYIGLGNTDNTWNSVTEIEVFGSGTGGGTTPSPPPGGGGCIGGTNASIPTSFSTGICLPDLNNNDYVALHLERSIPASTGHIATENYSIIIANAEPAAPPPEEAIPPSDPGNPTPPGTIPPIGGETPVPFPPGVFDPGTIPPIVVPPVPEEPPPVDTTPPPVDGTPPPSDGGGGGPSPGQTPDGVALVALPSGYHYGDQHTGFHENFQSNGSYRLDVGVQPQLDQLNLTFSLNLSSGSDEISSKLSGGTHTDSKAKNGRCYDIGINQSGDRVRIRKEDPHPSYHDGPSHSVSLGSLNGKWVFVQSLKWNEGSNCHLQCWVDTSGNATPSNKFVKILDDIDTGGWFESPYLHCYDSSDSQTTIRVDGMSSSKFHYGKLCATRIVPG